MDKIEKILNEYGLTMIEKSEPDDFNDEETLELKEVCRNEDGLALLEYDSDSFDSLLSIETACEIFPEYSDKIDIDKSYLMMWEDKIITD